MSMLDLSWNDDYLLGIDIIDTQHRQLFSYFEKIDDALRTGNAEEVLIVVNGLINYAVSHNTFEEDLMEKAGYPMLDSHHKIHESFKQRALKYLEKIEGGADPLEVAAQIRVYIGLWLISHVKQEDRDYAPYVKKMMKGTSASGLRRLLPAFLR